VIDIHAIARHYGGTVSGGEALIPTIGHSQADRGTAIKADPGAPDGCLVHCFNDGDPLAVKDRLRADGFLPPLRPKAVKWSWQTVATFEYADADGEVIYRTTRREPDGWSGPGKRPKRFVAQRFEDGRWIDGIKGIERVPYRLPELRQAIEAGGTVFVVEGEAKADKLAHWGFLATAVAFGAEGWKADYARHFAGARVVILPDNDEPGRTFARKVYGDLAKVAQPYVVELPNLPAKGDIIDWTGSAAELKALCADPTSPKWLHKKEDPSAFHFVRVGDLKYRPPEFLIEGMLETESLGMIFGDPGSGKSFVAVDLALSVATGTPFHCRAVRQGPVFLIAGEGHNGLTRRFAAWSLHRGVSIENAPLFVSNRPAQFLDAASAASVTEAVQALAKQHGKPALIEIDTLARNYGPGDENSTSDMSAFIAAVDNLKAEFSGCAVALVHHTGHADKKRGRGAMALKGALDWEYLVEKSGEAIVLTNTKMKDAEPPKPVAFALDNVTLRDGASSAALRETEAPARTTRLKGKDQVAMTALTDALAKHGRTGMGADYPAGVKVVPIDQWRAACAAHGLTSGSSDSAERTAFKRAKDRLIDLDLVRGFNGHFWKVRGDD
jgi:hypothetical protein